MKSRLTLYSLCTFSIGYTEVPPSDLELSRKFPSQAMLVCNSG